MVNNNSIEKMNFDLPGDRAEVGKCESKWRCEDQLVPGECQVGSPLCSSARLSRRPCDMVPPVAFPVQTEYEKRGHDYI